MPKRYSEKTRATSAEQSLIRVPFRITILTLKQILFFFLNVYSFFRERENTSGLGAERERDTESEAGSRLRAVSTESDAGLKLTECEIMT